MEVNVPSFTNNELKKYLWAGTAVLGLGIFMTIVATGALTRDGGVPEFLHGLRGTGWTAIVVSLVWIGFAGIRRLMQ